jgi:stringent starvation protein B
MISSRPYLIRAAYEWITDNGMTPHLVVDATFPRVAVPKEYVSEGRIILNVGQTAVQGLELGNQEIRFSARFGGMARQVVMPPGAVLGVYAHEDHEMRIFFPEELAQAEERAEEEDASRRTDNSEAGAKKPSLKVVK